MTTDTIRACPCDDGTCSHHTGERPLPLALRFVAWGGLLLAAGIAAWLMSGGGR